MAAEPGSAALSDALDELGRPASVLAPGIVPLVAGTVVRGRALPLTLVRPPAVPAQRYAGLLRALDAVGAGDVVVLGGAVAVEPVPALWGELLSTMAQARGAAGALVDGAVRDVAAIEALGFPVAARGRSPLDLHPRLEVVAHDLPVALTGAVVAPGDLVVADDDGAVVVPAALADEALHRARAKAAAEDGLRADVRAGAVPSQAFARHRVL